MCFRKIQLLMGHPVRNESIFDGLLFNLKKQFSDLEIHSPVHCPFGTFCVPIDQIFESCESLKIQENSGNRHSRSKTSLKKIFHGSLKTHCGSNNWPICTQKVPKVAPWTGLWINYVWLSKIFCLTWTGGHQKNVHDIHVWYTLDDLIWNNL